MVVVALVAGGFLLVRLPVPSEPTVASATTKSCTTRGKGVLLNELAAGVNDPADSCRGTVLNDGLIEHTETESRCPAIQSSTKARITISGMTCARWSSGTGTPERIPVNLASGSWLIHYWLTTTKILYTIMCLVINKHGKW
jgi:hypothetical protein